MAQKDQYSKSEIIEKLENALKTPETLYQEAAVNYTGKAGGESYSEIIAKYLLENLARWEKNIPTICREKSYRTPSHKGTATTGRTKATSTCGEEHGVLEMFGQTFPFLGEVLDYQVPLKNRQSDKAGKIDLLSRCGDGSVILLEYKTAGNTESLLHAVLEIYTYSQIIDGKKLLADFDLPKNTQIRKAVLVGHGSQTLKQYKNEWLYRLMSVLGVEIFVFNEKTQKVTLP